MSKYIFKTKKDLYDFLDKNNRIKNTDMGVTFFLVKYDSKVEPVYFTRYSDVYFPSPCELRSFPMLDNELNDYVKELYHKESYETALEFEKTMQKNNIHYEVDVPQVLPFLPEEIEILDVFSEEECLEYLLKEEKKRKEKEEK